MVPMSVVPIARDLSVMIIELRVFLAVLTIAILVVMILVVAVLVVLILAVVVLTLTSCLHCTGR
jgi:hypothetical protein